MKEHIRIAAIADLHIGKDSWGVPAEKWDEPLYEFSEWVRANEADYVAIPGDVYDKRAPTPEEYRRFVTWLDSIHCPVVGVGGNHDAYATGEDTALWHMPWFDGVHMQQAGLPYLLEGDSVSWLLVPWPRLLDYPADPGVSLEAWLRDAARQCEARILKLAEQAGNDKPLIVVGHAHVYYGAKSKNINEWAPPGPALIAGRDLLLSYEKLQHPNVSAVLLGHIHDPSQVSYVGSTQPTDLHDTVPKSFTVVDIDGPDVRYQRVPFDSSLKVADINIDTVVWGPEHEAMNGFRPADVLRATLSLGPGDAWDVDRLRKQLEAKARVKFLGLKVEPYRAPRRVEQLTGGETPRLATVKEAVALWTQARQMDGELATAVVGYCEDLEAEDGGSPTTA